MGYIEASGHYKSSIKHFIAESKLKRVIFNTRLKRRDEQDTVQESPISSNAELN
jgi:hypothetical protein